MSFTCPNGHASESPDYCDTCGAPISESPASTPTPDAASSSGQQGSGSSGTAAPSATQPCPNCGLINTADALFCEGCGYDFTTGTMPREAAPAPVNTLDLGAAPAPPAAPDASAPGAASGSPDAQSPPSTAPVLEVEWVAEVWVDPDWYAEQQSDEPCPSPGLPVVVPLRAQSLLIGRTSRSRNIHPEIECAADIGVSRRQAQLTSDGQRWWVEDLQSSNGTFVGAASGELPTDPIPPGQRRELAVDDHIYVGAWTCIVIRKATPEEKAGQA